MADTTADTVLARKAREVLTAIEENRASFDMNSWCDTPGGTLVPDDDVCGTTLCVAGWRVHLDGWTLRGGGDYATKGDVSQWTETAAIEAFEPATDDERRHLSALFYTSEDRALAVLRYVAEHGSFPAEGVNDDEALGTHFWD